MTLGEIRKALAERGYNTTNVQPLCHWYPHDRPHTAICGHQREQLIADDEGPRCLVCEDMRPKTWF